MITTADALEIMAVVTACHQRTAPRTDDREVAIATATVWVELFNEYNFKKPELVAAVKNRAKACTEAPEAADIIRVARATRSDLMARTEIGTDPRGDDEHYPGDAKAAPDPGDYPAEWDSNQRTSAYWYARSLQAMPHTTAGWEGLAAQLKHKRAERAAVIGGEDR